MGRPWGQVWGDRVIMTPPVTAQRLIQFLPPLPYSKQIAMKSLDYFHSVKVFLTFTRPFWAEENKAPKIRFADIGDGLSGGTGITDNLLFQTYYPSNSLHGPALL